MTRARHSRAFTLTDLCILLAAAAVLCGGGLPLLLARTREPAFRVKCASNLRQIGQALAIYAAANSGSLPRAVDDGRGSPPTHYTNPLATDSFRAGGPGPNDVAAALFVLLRETDLVPEVFVCPTAPDATPWNYAGRTVRQVSNFPGRQYLSYSYLNVYPTPAAVASGVVVNPTPSLNFAVAADMNPGGSAVLTVTPTSSRPQQSAANSRNHNGDAQNVLYSDGHVEFQNTPFCGELRVPSDGGAPYRDNIYTSGAGWGADVALGRSPVDALDSILLPTARDGPAPVVGARPATLLMRGIIAAAVVGALVIVVPRLRRKSKAPRV